MDDTMHFLSLQKKELRLYYNNEKKYLLFKAIEPNILANTNWKLTGFANIETGEIHTPEPTGEDVFLISFNGEYGFSGFSSTNQLEGIYFLIDEETSSMYVDKIKMTSFDEFLDGGKYLRALRMVRLFSLQKNELQLFYGREGKEKDYLIFKKIIRP
jgi:hypothetical protein